MKEPYFDKQANTGLRHLMNATVFSWRGIKSACQHEAAFRQEVVLLGLALPAAWLIATSAQEYAMLIASVILILIVELLNSAIEATVDRISTEQHELSGRAKDLGSAAVMLSIALAVIVWGAVAWQHI